MKRYLPVISARIGSQAPRSLTPPCLLAASKDGSLGLSSDSGIEARSAGGQAAAGAGGNDQAARAAAPSGRPAGRSSWMQARAIRVSTAEPVR